MENMDMSQFEQNQGLIGGILGGLGVGFIIFYLLFIALIIVSLWKVFEKAGKPGWASIVPIYNIVVMLKIVKKPLWWILLLLIPFVNVIIGIIVCIEMAKAFGKDIGFAIGLLLLGFIFYPILAFGDAKYVYGDNAEETPAS